MYTHPPPTFPTVDLHPYISMYTHPQSAPKTVGRGGPGGARPRDRHHAPPVPAQRHRCVGVWVWVWLCATLHDTPLGITHTHTHDICITWTPTIHTHTQSTHAGAHSGSYCIYKALAVAAGVLDPHYRPKVRLLAFLLIVTALFAGLFGIGWMGWVGGWLVGHLVRKEGRSVGD